MLAAVAFVPLVLAYVNFHLFPGFSPSSTTNGGLLISPPVGDAHLGLQANAPIPRGVWTIVVPCRVHCSETLYLARQVNVALGKNADRVQRLLLVSLESVGEAGLYQDYPGMLVRHVDLTGLSGLIEQVAPGTSSRPFDGSIFLVDPHGNVMMYYAPDQAGEALLKDLKHLLRLSNIG